MANRLFNPILQFCDQAGLPYAGGTLSFFLAGTSTPAAVFSNPALTVSLGSVVTLDSAGRPNSSGAGGSGVTEVGIFFGTLTGSQIQNIAYKVVLADVNANQIWSADNVYASDFSAVAQVQGTAGSPNGTLAGTQANAGTVGTVGIPASMDYDYTNNILYVCTTTGNAAGAVWTAVNASAAAATVPPPQGYLTLASDPLNYVLAAGVSNVTQVFYSPAQGLLVPIYNGTSFVPTSIVGQLTYNLSASHTQNNIYDFFIFSNAGVATLVTGPTWAAGTAGSVTAGSCARGTGAGGAALTRLQGFPTNAVSMTMRTSGGSTPTVPANQATYVGSMFVNGAGNGQVTSTVAYGGSRTWALWNPYNKAPIQMIGGDTTASWAYAVVTWRQSRATASNTIASFCGLPEEQVMVDFEQNVVLNQTSNPTQIGIGLNSIVVGGLVGMLGNCANGSAGAPTCGLLAKYINPPQLGINNYNMMEIAPVGAVSQTFNGTNSNMQMTVNYRG